MSRRTDAAFGAAGLDAPVEVLPQEQPQPAAQTLEERRFWRDALPKPRQEAPCVCVKDGTPDEFCAACLGTGMHARRDPGDMRGGTPPGQKKATKRATKAPEKT